jgi:putative transposase
MPNTYSQIYIQVVFAVKGRKNYIAQENREELQKYITGIIENKNTKLIAIYCMPDHIHILIGMKPSTILSDLVKQIKVSATNFINASGWQRSKFSWQEGFGAFSYSHSHLKHVISYVNNQELHHEQKTFRQEYIAFLQKQDILYDAKYLFDWDDEKIEILSEDSN